MPAGSSRRGERATRSEGRITRYSLEGLEKLGWNDGRNVRIDVRWGAGDAQRLRASAVELVGSKPDVIVAGGGSAVERLK